LSSGFGQQRQKLNQNPSSASIPNPGKVHSRVRIAGMQSGGDGIDAKYGSMTRSQSRLTVFDPQPVSVALIFAAYGPHCADRTQSKVR
jgi:hypothetical protein